MASRRISLSLKNINSYNADTVLEAEISNNFRQDTKPPRVGWTLNTVPTVDGIKSVNYHSLHPKILDLVRNVGSAVFDYQQLDILVDEFGTSYPMAIFTEVSVASDAAMYVLTTNTTFLGINSISASQGLRMHKWHTLFQGSTLFIIPPNSGQATNGDLLVDGAGDIPGNNDFGTIRMGTSGGSEQTTGFVNYHNVTGTVLNDQNLRGMISFGNYVILFTDDEIRWCDPNDFTEFTVGGASLAGVSKISELRGRIVTCVPDKTGFIIYGTENMIHAAFSGDSSNPWIFSEIINSSGLQEIDHKPVVTHTAENQNFHVALTTTAGLALVSAEGMRPLPEKLAKVMNEGFMETKAVGTDVIVKVSLLPTLGDVKTPKVKKLFSYGENIFILLGESSEFALNDVTRNRLVSFNTATGKVGVLDGYFLSIIPNIFFKDANGGGIFDSNASQADNYLVTKYEPHDTVPASDLLRNYIVDFNSLGAAARVLPLTDYTDTREAEVFLGEVSISPDRLTELIKVKLVGETLPATGLEAERVRVFVYSSVSATPIEFLYFPLLDEYLGFAVGENLQVEIRGHHFNLTDCILEIQDGGRI